MCSAGIPVVVRNSIAGIQMHRMNSGLENKVYLRNPRYFYFILGLILGVIFYHLVNLNTGFSYSDSLGMIDVPMDPFPEPEWRTSSTLAIKTVTSTHFARFQIHKVKTENGKIVSDWLWTDELSHVNILIHLKEEDKYMLFYQSKYGLNGKKLAAIGGLFNDNETPEQCATRELLEETGLETNELINLGKYRVQVNRGGGFLHSFYAKNCVKSKAHKPSDDYEKLEIRKYSRKELIQEVLRGEIGEAQWLATIALGLLYEEFSHKD